MSTPARVGFEGLRVEVTSTGHRMTGALPSAEARPHLAGVRVFDARVRAPRVAAHRAGAARVGGPVRAPSSTSCLSLAASHRGAEFETIGEMGFRYSGSRVWVLAPVPTGKCGADHRGLPGAVDLPDQPCAGAAGDRPGPGSDCGTSPQRAGLPNAPLSRSRPTSNRPAICAGNGWGGVTDTRSSVLQSS